MDDELRQRRQETWDLLVVKGIDYGKVVSRIASKYDISESGVESDISRMDNWLPELDPHNLESGLSRIRELRQNRQRLQQMALEAQNEGNLDKELRIRRQIEESVETDVELAQSLGLTEKEAEEVEVGWREFIQTGHDEADDGESETDDS